MKKSQKEYIETVLKDKYTLGLPDTFFKYEVMEERGEILDIMVYWGFGPRLRYQQMETIQSEIKKPVKKLQPDKKKICAYCSEPFPPFKATQKYCCTTCYNKAFYEKKNGPKDKVCKICGKTFTQRFGMLTCGNKCAEINSYNLRRNYLDRKRGK